MTKIGRYDVVEELGRGAMGVVYKASDPTIGRLVAIKVLTLDSSPGEGTQSSQDIFMREARAAGRLSHSGIVTIHDALADPETRNNYIVMEFIPGQTLERVLLQGPPLTIEKALELLRQIAEALEYAHQQGIIHRDLKPANILITEDGKIKITDFGIAKIMAREGATRTTSVMGTPSYMSPEQVTGHGLDARSDLFSLGILAYLMLTGEKPFAGDTAAVMFKIVYEDPVQPSTVRPELTPAHDFLVLRCLAKDLDKRYASAREFLEDLDDVLHGWSPRSQTRIPPGEIRSGERTMVAPRGKAPLMTPQASSAGSEKRARNLWAGAGVIVILAVLGSGIAVYRHRHPKRSPALAVTSTAPSTAAVPPPIPVSTSTSAPPVTTPSSVQLTAPSPTPGAAGATSQGPGAESADVEANNTPVGSEMASSEKSRQQKSSSKRIKNKKAKSTGSESGASKSSSSQTPSSQPPAPLPVTATPAASLLAASHAAPTPPSAAKSTGSARTIQLVCRFDLPEAALSVSGDSGDIFQGKLKGRKKAGLLHIKSSYAGVLSRPINIPPGTRDISVHVVSSDGAIDLKRKLSAAGLTSSLDVDVRGGQLSLHWAAPAHP